MRFDDQETRIAYFDLPEGLVLDGTNTLSVRGELPADQTHSFFVVHAVEVDFDRRLVPVAGTSVVPGHEGATADASAFTDPLVIALGQQPSWIADASGGLPGKAWSLSGADRFAVIEADAVPVLTPRPAAADAWFMADDVRIDYLLITSRGLADAAQELADYRATQGLRVGVALFDDMCDLFAGGQRTPEAIPALLHRATARWTEAPWLIALAGSGHYDYLDALQMEVNPLPPQLQLTARGLFASDGLMTDLDGDEEPDIAVGRLPARTPEELSAMIAKIKNHEAQHAASWQRVMVLAADASDKAGDFRAGSEKLAALAGEELDVERIYVDETGITAARTQWLGSFESGAGVMHYTGHGGARNFSSANLLSAADVATLDHERRPVMVALTCLAGRFESPGSESMGELLMRRSEGGAVAVWGPSGLSENEPAVTLGSAFYAGVLHEGCSSLGPAVLRARQGMRGLEEGRDTFLVYNLLGDPALKLGGRPGADAPDASFAEWRWQHFDPEQLMDPALSGVEGGRTGEAANLLLYATGTQPGDGALPPGMGLYGIDEEGGLIIEWRQRIARHGLGYDLRFSGDLFDWSSGQAAVEILSTEPDADGIMETVRARVLAPAGMRQLFINLLISDAP